jgi:hypothetical protein
MLRFYLIPVRMAIIKKIKNKCGQGFGKTGNLYPVGGNVN